MRDEPAWDNLQDQEMYPYEIKRSIAMTQHLLQEQTEEDQRIMRRLAIVVGGFLVFTVFMAVTVGAMMG
jgi:hypothetical protein